MNHELEVVSTRTVAAAVPTPASPTTALAAAIRNACLALTGTAFRSLLETSRRFGPVTAGRSAQAWVNAAAVGYLPSSCGVLNPPERIQMKWFAAALAFAAVACAGTLIALGTASGAPANTTVSTGTTVTAGTNVSVSSSASSSCVVSSSSVNGVATTESSGCGALAQACSVVISATHDVTTTTRSSTCGTVSIYLDARELRLLVSSWIWFLFAAAR